MINLRVENLRKQMKSNGVKSCLITRSENVTYISGFEAGGDAFLFITEDKVYAISDPRYIEDIQTNYSELTYFNWRTKKLTKGDGIATLVEREKSQSMWFENDSISFSLYQDVASKVKTELVPMQGIIELMRIVKDQAEIHKLRISCDIACRALEKLTPMIKIGKTEKELGAELSKLMVMEGADNQPYGNIFLSGERTSLLHGKPSERSLRYGDLILIDFGCQYEGYLSDLTRMLIVGEPTAMQQKIYDMELSMLNKAKEKIFAGSPVRDIYRNSIIDIKDTEYLKYTYGNIGHGIGLDVHEGPFTGENFEDILLENNVRTIEPGIYIPEWGGIRLEDQMLVTKDGFETMTNYPLELKRV